MYSICMDLERFLEQAHYVFLARHGKKTQAEVAKAIGIKHRTYVEYLRGVNKPLGMIALLNLLSQLPERDLVDLINEWKEQK